MRYTSTYHVTDLFIQQAMVSHQDVGLKILDAQLKEKGYKRNPGYSPRFIEDEKYRCERGEGDGTHKFRVIADYTPMTPEEDRNG